MDSADWRMGERSVSSCLKLFFLDCDPVILIPLTVLGGKWHFYFLGAAESKLSRGARGSHALPYQATEEPELSLFVQRERNPKDE